jgi:CRP-like cAMP-binding protein
VKTLAKFKKDCIKNGHIVDKKQPEQLQQVIEILYKAPEKRTEKEILIITKLICQLNIFKYKRCFTFEECMEVAKQMQYRRVEAGNYIFKQGEKADYFYIVLKGTV